MAAALFGDVGLEDVREELRLDAGAVVADHQGGVAALTRLDGHPDLAAGGAGLEAVEQQIEQHLGEHLRVGGHIHDLAIFGVGKGPENGSSPVQVYVGVFVFEFCEASFKSGGLGFATGEVKTVVYFFWNGRTCPVFPSFFACFLAADCSIRFRSHATACGLVWLNVSRYGFV